MAKKDISKFQKALLSKTNVMKAPPKRKEELMLEKTIVSSDLNFKIEKKILDKYNILSEKHKIDFDELVTFGLKFFLEFEDELLER